MGAKNEIWIGVGVTALFVILAVAITGPDEELGP